MPIYKQGDMWSVYDEVDYFCITTNSFIKKDGCLVMGRGIAKEAKYSLAIEESAGTLIKEYCGHLGEYNILFLDNIVLFQVKKHFKDIADINLIYKSTVTLSGFAKSYPDAEFALNFPGIGNGKLNKEQVKPIIDLLPDNVQVWEL